MGKPKQTFDIDDYMVSDSYPLLAKNVVPSEKVADRLFYCHRMFVLPIQDWTDNEVLFITSGYRNPELNKAIGGGNRSQHLLGEAIDVTLLNEPFKLVGLMDFVEDALYYQTGFCYVWYVEKDKTFKHMHWSLPRDPRGPQISSDNKFWWFDGKNFHRDPPEGYREWCPQ